MGRLLAQADENQVFIAGCSEEQVEFAWDMQVLLTAPKEVMLDRLQTRSGNTYGRSLIEQEQVLADLANVDPLLRRTADLEDVRLLVNCHLHFGRSSPSASNSVTAPLPA